MRVLLCCCPCRFFKKFTSTILRRSTGRYFWLSVFALRFFFKPFPMLYLLLLCLLHGLTACVCCCAAAPAGLKKVDPIEKELLDGGNFFFFRESGFVFYSFDRSVRSCVRCLCSRFTCLPACASGSAELLFSAGLSGASRRAALPPPGALLSCPQSSGCIGIWPKNFHVLQSVTAKILKGKRC